MLELGGLTRLSDGASLELNACNLQLKQALWNTRLKWQPQQIWKRNQWAT
jgi:hypothetical protein